MLELGVRVIIFDLMEKSCVHLLSVSCPCCAGSEQVTIQVGNSKLNSLIGKMGELDQVTLIPK